ncbi:MAG TPA: 50S ribosomal protein L25 [Anaerolineae bacterium]|nr:50S ribosomal protein L25 [Anaerolineae bacterium]
MDYVLNVEPRTVTGRHVKRVRAAGFVPAVVYGQGEPATPIQFREIDMVRILRSGGLSQLIELKGLAKPMNVLVKEVQRHPIRRTILHVDFYRVQMDVKIQTNVPVHTTGESEAIKGGAVLIHHMDNITVECLPGNIPEALVADLSKLKTLDDVITVADLPVPEGVVVLAEPEAPVFSLTISRKLAAEEAAGEVEAGEDEEAGESEEA